MIWISITSLSPILASPLMLLGDQFYKEAIEQCRSYNARLCAERSVRLPFLDSQTGVAQNNCYIWMERHQRSPGLQALIYTEDAAWRERERERESVCVYGGLMSRNGLPTQSTTLEALLRGEGLDKRKSSKNDEESLLEIQRVLEADAAEDAFNDDDDYEVDIPKRRHRGKGRGRGSGRRRADLDDDKPYICDICTKRYRNRPGLSYHYTHSHLAEEGRAGERSTVTSRSPAAPQTDRHKRPKSSGGTSIPNNYCNKCSNRKTGKSGSPCSACQSDRGEEKEDGTLTGAEELFGTTSESDTSTFHGFEDDELEDPAANGNGIPIRHR
uniref:Double PHD fingers 3 n=1 Tax=Nothobranchius furzeri TaxID=105023 RepID=A0A8C6P1R3_NOTFU